MPDLFREIIPSILQTKKSVIKDDIDLKDYKPFMVNRALSYHMDCVLYANEMNMHGLLDADMQYQYLLNTIRPMKRGFAPWQKANVDKDIECIKLYYGYSDNKAKDALTILTDEQIAEIKIRTEKGGVKK
jgi:hypothetical protein